MRIFLLIPLSILALSCYRSSWKGTISSYHRNYHSSIDSPQSRLVYQAESERNYHIFYQFLAGTDKRDKGVYYQPLTYSNYYTHTLLLLERYQLLDINQYHYLNQSGCTSVPTIDDHSDYDRVRVYRNVPNYYLINPTVPSTPTRVHSQPWTCQTKPKTASSWFYRALWGLETFSLRDLKSQRSPIPPVLIFCKGG